MASNIGADLSEKLSPNVESCKKHIGFTLDFVCKLCRKSVCAQCVVVDHPGHDIGQLKIEKISELRENLEIRKRYVKVMKKNCQEMLQHVHEMTEEKLLVIEENRDKERSLVERQRNDFARRTNSITKCLEQEENKIYAIEYSSETALSTEQEENNLKLYDIQEQLGQCTNGQLPRVKTYKDLKVKFKRLHSVNKYSSSSTTALEEWERTTLFATSSSTTSSANPIAMCSSWSQEVDPLTSQTNDVEAFQKLGREKAKFIFGDTTDESETLEGAMDTDEEMGACGGLEFESGENEEVHDEEVHSERDEVVLYDLAGQILPDNLSPLGACLGVSTVTIEQIRYNNHRCIAEAIYKTLLEWKKNVSADVLTEKHFKKLERCLREIRNNLAADWLVERLQKSTEQLPAQPSSLLDHLVQPSASPGQPLQPSSPSGQLEQPSSSAQP